MEGDCYTFKCGKKTKIKYNTSCNAKHVIYVIICSGCKEEYIQFGETNDLRKRMTVHRQQIRDSRVRMLRMSDHINNWAREEPRFLVFPFYKMQTDSIVSRKQKVKIF
jgi:hypothetical protein